MADRDTLTQHMLRAGRQWAVCVAMGDYDEARVLADEITGYSAALDRIDNPWDILKGSPEHG